MEGADHLLKAIGITIDRGASRFDHVLGEVVSDLVARFDKLNVHDEGVASCYVPFLRELGLIEESAAAEDVQVGMPVGGRYCPFDFEDRRTTVAATTPPAAAPHPPERSKQPIKSFAESSPISGDCEGDEPSGAPCEPSPEAAGNVAPASCCTGGAEPVVTVIGPDADDAGVVAGALHPSARATAIETVDPSRSNLSSFKSSANPGPVNQPTTMSKSQLQVIIRRIPASWVVVGLRDGCFWRVK